MAKTNKQIREELKLERKFKMKLARKESSVVLKCGKCGYVWRPDPHKWRNGYPTMSAWKIVKENIPKYLKCPCCGNVNPISPELLAQILR